VSGSGGEGEAFGKPPQSSSSSLSISGRQKHHPRFARQGTENQDDDEGRRTIKEAKRRTRFSCHHVHQTHAQVSLESSNRARARYRSPDVKGRPVPRAQDRERERARGRLGWIKDLEGGAGRGGAGFDA
jgi:hypothetical protein